MIGLAVSAGGCGSSGATGSSSAVLGPLARAAYVTSAVSGAHMALAAQVSASGLSSPVTISGEGFFDYRAREGMMSLEMSGLPAGGSATGGPSSLHVEELIKPAALYVGSPLFAGKLPGGARWMKLDLASLDQSLGFNPQQLIGGESNPAQFLEYLKASGGAVTVVGHESVRGVPTTRYAGTIDLKKLAAVMPSPNRAQLRAALAKVIAETGVSSLPVEAWVDAGRLVRRITTTFSVSANGQSARMSLTFELFGFGATPAVTAPPEGEVYDATSAALAGLSAAGG
jgi:hypothetical protein